MATKTKSKKSKKVSETEVQEFNGNPILNLEPEAEFRPFSFGVRKAKLILQHVEAIQEFVDEYGDEDDKPRRKKGRGRRDED